MIDGSEKMKSCWMRVGGRQIHACVSTIGHPPDTPSVVLVHGLGVSGRYMIPTAVRLAKHYRVFVPDLPGFGESEKPFPVLDIGGLADALVGWMDAMQVGPAALVCNSMGCQVAVQAAIDHPEFVTRMILQGPTIDPAVRNAFGQVMRLIADAPLEPPSMTAIAVRDYLKCGTGCLAATLRHSLRDPVEEKLAMIDVPTLVVRGARDPIVSQQWAEKVARLLPKGRLVVIPGAAHAVNYAQPDEFVRIIRFFLSNGEQEYVGRRSGPDD